MSDLEFPAIMHVDGTTVPVIILAPSYERCLADADHATGPGQLWDGWECIVLATGPR